LFSKASLPLWQTGHLGLPIPVPVTLLDTSAA
jgi:hypothetical protein